MEQENSLLQNCTSGGCGAKIGPGELSSLLQNLPVFCDTNLKIGYNTSDDASVYEVAPNLSIVNTADFFPPMVDDPTLFGQIAAANALSDIYAMGAKPITALNLVCFPSSMDLGVLRRILQGGAEKVAEAACSLAGGHSVYDKEPKYGLAVTGIAPTDKIIRNNTPRVSDLLILTKPLGVGIVMAALRGQLASPAAVKKATDSMSRLNRYAAEKMDGYSISACTDITGFGLLAHLLEMADTNVSIKIFYQDLPYIPEAKGYADDFLLTAAGQRNRNHVGKRANVANLPFAIQELIFDPQTSGGLLICVDKNQAASLLKDIQADDPQAKIIGEITTRENETILF